MKTSISTRFLRLVAPEFRFSLVTSTRPRMAVLMNTVRMAARVMTQLRRSEPKASRKKSPTLRKDHHLARRHRRLGRVLR